MIFKERVEKQVESRGQKKKESRDQRRAVESWKRVWSRGMRVEVRGQLVAFILDRINRIYRIGTWECSKRQKEGKMMA